MSESAARRERMIRFLADCLLTGTNPIIADEDEALTVAEAMVDLGIERGVFDV